MACKNECADENENVGQQANDDDDDDEWVWEDWRVNCCGTQIKTWMKTN